MTSFGPCLIIPWPFNRLSSRKISAQTSDSIRLLVARAVLEENLVPACVVSQGVVVYANARFWELFGRAPEPIPIADLAIADERDQLLRLLAPVLHGGSRTGIHFQARRADGTRFEAEGELVRVVGAADSTREATLVMTLADVSARRRSLMELQSLAFTDPLTGISNRALFLDRLRTTLLQARRQGGGFAILVCDLDGFKSVNDTLGHDAGDTVLKTVAQRITGMLRDGDTVARMGGDEFAVVVTRLGRAEDAALVAGRIIKAVGKPIALKGTSVQPGASVGIAAWPDHGNDVDTLYLQADAALFTAKRAGRDRYAFATMQGEEAAGVYIPFFEWSEAHAVGVAVIDEQHQRLAEMINALGKALKSGAEREQLVVLFGELGSYAQMHFATEEALMDEFHVPEAEHHKGEHHRLIEDLLALSINMDSRSMVLTMRHLQNWLFRHIDSADRPLAIRLRPQGVA